MNIAQDNKASESTNGVGLSSGTQAQAQVQEVAEFHKFPSLFPELQLRIVGHLVDKKDILNVILVNKSSYCLCIELLYRDLNWSNPIVCAGIIRQAELQRRNDIEVAVNLTQGPAFPLGHTQNLPFPRFPTAFTTLPRSLVLSLAYNTRKPQHFKAHLDSHEFFADVGTTITSTTGTETSGYLKKMDKRNKGCGSAWDAFVDNLGRMREPLCFSNRDFRVDLPTVMASMDTMDLTSQIPHWEALEYVYSGVARNKRTSDRFYFYTSFPLYNEVLVTITRFTNLNTLVFYNSNLPPRLYDTIVLLPNLRSLVIDACFLPPFILPGVEVDDDIDVNEENEEQDFMFINAALQQEALPTLPTLRDFSQLPITSLTLLQIRRHAVVSYPHRSRAYIHDIHSRSLDEVQVFKLASAENLTELVVDWTDVSARYFGGVLQDSANMDDRMSTNPMVAAFGRYASTAYPDSYHESTTTGTGDDGGSAPLNVGNQSNLTAIVTNDPSGQQYVPPRGLTSVTLNMGTKWRLPFVEPPHVHAMHPPVTVLDCSALLSSFLRKFEDGVDEDPDPERPGLQHLKIFSSGASQETVIAWQSLRDRMEGDRRATEVENGGGPLVGVGGGGGEVPLALRTLDVEQRMTSVFFPLHPSIILPHLKSFMGPLHTIPNVLRRSVGDNDSTGEWEDGMGSYVAQNLERVVVWDEMWFVKAYPSNQIKISDRESRDMDEEAVATLRRGLGVQTLCDALGLGFGLGTPRHGSSSRSRDVGEGEERANAIPMRKSLKVLKVPLTEWSEEILYAISQNMRDLRVLEVCYSRGEISEYTLLSLGARFLSKLPHLHTLRLWNPSSTWKDNRDRLSFSQFDGAIPPELAFAFDGRLKRTTNPKSDVNVDSPKRMDDRETGDEEDTGELELRCLMAWKSYIRRLREFQLFPGVVWRRHGTTDVWTKREVVREGLDLDLDLDMDLKVDVDLDAGLNVEVDKTAVVMDLCGGGWTNGLCWRYWDKRDVVKASWRRGCGLEALA